MRVAVVGSGVSGLGAAWLLNEHSAHDVHVYEADSRPGGHANTVDYTLPGKENSIPVDTGFIVLNPVTYPNFLRFLKLKNIPVLPTEMTFSVSRDMGQFEWAGDNLFAVFCQPSRLLDPNMWSLIYDVLRFNACSRKILLEKGPDKDISIGKYLDMNGYSSSFRDNYLIPMTAAVWSTSPDKCSLDFPARTLIQFLHNHHLLQITGKPSWLTIPGGSKVYVEAITRNLKKGHLHLSSPVCSVKSLPLGKLELQTSTGEVELFDHVIFTCHSDTALEILKAGNVTPEEEHILSMFRWNRNEAVLHSDTRLMPKSRLAWSCWNYLSSSAIDEQGNFKANIDRVSLTYWMNALQHIPQSHGPILVTLNPPFPPNPSTIQGTYTYSHPILSSKSLTAQSLIHKIQNTRGISYAGAYLRYGFHEDGFTSGLRAASKYLGDVRLPFEIRDPDRDIKYIWLSVFFEMIEGSGVRGVLGYSVVYRFDTKNILCSE
ncbi:FAD/NAD-binding domain-containing protein [Fomitiporia mediterranea MF3/22]|uniref:FAD/NAD-binding domain-containing protein n=1 Tax=Fomitiporia mediterranea (strain MF3/22) TaxID=694068 RepID=UPI000440853A|nr:FAD/NAD-binding domain-containing protein [Fomitiporia mediterranea MF3/22]EJC98838.1 FAD/NAD-binding domain-containing protein [Fomitiporia mediterranea MF3/22]